jgi:excisionase family DNA binding protein
MHEKLLDVMTIEEVMAYLRISRSSLYTLAQEGKIPAQKVGRDWRFPREAIERWLEGVSVKPVSADRNHDN